MEIDLKGLKGRAEPMSLALLSSSLPVERGEEKGKDIVPLDWIVRILLFISRCKIQIDGNPDSVYSKYHNLESKMAFFFQLSLAVLLQVYMCCVINTCPPDLISAIISGQNAV